MPFTAILSPYFFVSDLVSKMFSIRFSRFPLDFFELLVYPIDMEQMFHI